MTEMMKQFSMRGDASKVRTVAAATAQRVGKNGALPLKICASGDSLAIVFGKADPP